MEGAAYLCGLLHNCEFKRRVGNDINRAIDGTNLRKEFLTQFEDAEFDPRLTNELMAQECSWFEMLVALAKNLDYYYDGGVDGRFGELIENMELMDFTVDIVHRSRARIDHDQRAVEITTSAIDNNDFGLDGKGGIFPLRSPHHRDQRMVEIWSQAGIYFNERL